jgi:hypothetical protein
VPSRILVVSPPRKASVAYASGMGEVGGRPLSRIWKKWSMTHRLSTPASSAAMAILDMAGPISSAGQGNVVMPMPSFMKASSPDWTGPVGPEYH